MQFKDKVVIVTGGAQGIGRCIADEFGKEGAHVCVIDKKALSPTLNLYGEGVDYFQGDLSVKETIEEFCRWVIDKHGHVDYIVNNALPLMKGIDECSYEEFQYAMSVGVTAPFYLAKLLKDCLNPNATDKDINRKTDLLGEHND